MLYEFGAAAEPRRSATRRSPADRYPERTSASRCAGATHHSYSAASHDYRSADTHHHQGRGRRYTGYASDHDRSSSYLTGSLYTSQSADESIDAVASMSGDGNSGHAKWSSRKCK